MQSQSPLILKTQEDKTSVAYCLRQSGFLIIWLCPFFTYLIELLFYTYGFLYVPGLCIMYSAIAFIVAVGLIIKGMPGKPPRVALKTGIALVPAVVVSTALGLFLFDQYAIFPQFYNNARQYTNVVPAQPAAAVSDAGKIVFSTESYVAVSQSISYIREDGLKYCVAPIRDGSGITRLEFWAAGIECCGQAGEFWCDATRDASAHAGIVVFDNNGWFTDSRYKYYEKARMKAQAQYALASVTEPIYVRWVKEANLEYLSNDYKHKAGTWVTIFTLMWLVLSFVLAYYLFTTRKHVL